MCGGNVEGTITNCYSTGLITGDVYAGGLCGTNDANSTTNYCFWDVETSDTAVGIGYNLSSSSGVTGKTTVEMKTPSTFFDAGWDLVTVWNIEQGQTYPLLRKYSAVDTNYDNKVNFADFAYFADHWLDGEE